MVDSDKTGEQLLEELTRLRRKITELEASEVTHINKVGEFSQSREFLIRILDRILDPCIVIDRNYKIVDVNSCFVERYNSQREKLIGQTCYEVICQSSQPCHKTGNSCPLG